MRSVHRRLDRGLILVENLAAIVAGVVMLCTMALVTVDVFMRHVLANPLTFQLHLVQYYMLTAMLLLALPWGYRNGGAIQIKLLTGSLPDRIVDPLMRVILAVSAVYLFVLAHRGFKAFIEALEINKVVLGVIDWPVAWSWVWVPIGCGLLGIRLAVDATAPELRSIGSRH